MAKGTMTLFGGSGFLGRRVAGQALEAGWRVRVASRRLRPDLFAGELPPPEHLAVDVRDPEAVNEAVRGAAAVVNAVSLYVENRTDSFQSIHVDAAARIAAAAQDAGARLVHLSGIGVDPRSPSAYVRARALGEQRVREAHPQSIIVRPSVLFGDDDAFLSSVTALVRWLPVIPLFGTGKCRLQPVHVDDAARAVIAALERGDAPGRTYELGGPDAFTYHALLKAVAGRLGKRRWLLPVPFTVWRLLALAAAPLPEPPITRDQVELLRHDNIVRTDHSFQSLGIETDSLKGLPETVAGAQRSTGDGTP